MFKRFAAPVILILMICGQAHAQIARNPKLSPDDQSLAQSQSREAGGAGAELVYAARLDLVQKGSFDSLVVIYSSRVKAGKEFYGFVYRNDKRFPLVFDQEGRALKSGDAYYRIGLRHGESGSPVLRLMGSFTDQTKREMIRNLDFQFDGNAFALIGQSTFPLPK
ncbi:MAG: hypothetical protein IPM66_08385 [Acidobacteriota bacterium]|nr:MAG: hypothetical protein IPM66_08385 [Acidobacteriota bacterium]